MTVVVLTLAALLVIAAVLLRRRRRPAAGKARADRVGRRFAAPNAGAPGGGRRSQPDEPLHRKAINYLASGVLPRWDP